VLPANPDATNAMPVQGHFLPGQSILWGDFGETVGRASRFMPDSNRGAELLDLLDSPTVVGNESIVKNI
jgi:hypothetical protein